MMRSISFSRNLGSKEFKIKKPPLNLTECIWTVSEKMTIEKYKKYESG